MEHSIELEIEIQNVSRRRSHSTDKANFGHFTLLLLLLRTQRSLQRFLRTCTVIVLLMKRFVVAVVVFFNSLMSPNYRLSRKCSDTLLIPTPEFLVLSDGELTIEGGKNHRSCLAKTQPKCRPAFKRYKILWFRNPQNLHRKLLKAFKYKYNNLHGVFVTQLFYPMFLT